MPKTRPTIPLNHDILSIIGHVSKWVVSYPEWTPIIFLSFWSVGTSGGCRLIAVVMESLHPAGDTVPETGVPSMGRPTIMATSYIVTVVSPHGRWNMWVFERHQSTSAINTAESIIGRSPGTRRASGRNPARCLHGVYRSSHNRGLCVQILSGNSCCVTQQWYKNISPNY
jgi:hypothetical protein